MDEQETPKETEADAPVEDSDSGTETEEEKTPEETPAE